MSIRIEKTPPGGCRAGRDSAFSENAFPGRNTRFDIATKTAPRQAANVPAAIKDLWIDASVEAAHMAAIAARHFVEDMETGDLWAAEHNLGVAVAHLREAASKFRAWQGKPLRNGEGGE